MDIIGNLSPSFSCCGVVLHWYQRQDRQKLQYASGLITSDNYGSLTISVSTGLLSCMLVCVCISQHVVLALFKLSQCMQLISLLSHCVELRIVQSI